MLKSTFVWDFFADKFLFVNRKFTVSAFQKFYKDSIIKQQQDEKG